MEQRGMHRNAASRNTGCGLCCTRIENFGVTIGGSVILHDVNMHIHCNELTALIGPNGAGKSTLLKAILGQVEHTGELKYLDAKGLHTGRPAIGYVPQSINTDYGSPLSVADLFVSCNSLAPSWLLAPKGVLAKAAEALAKVQAEHLLKRRLCTLSGGELQRVLLALALQPLPDLLLLDEPVAGVDEKGMMLFFDIVGALRQDYDLSIILVSHDLKMLAKHADTVVLLNKTVIACGTPKAVFSGKSFRSTFLPVQTEDKTLKR
ncbi:MAG: ATP-binding cassette domain-containing protein [Bacillota bacterium]|nr:ATP-binding cassette domain-containing protein [Bacillota bacterium]